MSVHWQQYNYRREIMQFFLGFCFAALFVPVPYFSDVIPLYRATCQYVLKPIFIMLIFAGNFARGKNYSSISLRLFFLLCLFCVLLLLTSIIGEKNILSAIALSISIIGVPLFFLSVGSKVPYSVLKGICAHLMLLTVLNILTIILFSNTGLYNTGSGRNYYFLGHVNSSVKIELPAVAILSTLNIYKHGRISKSTWVFTFLVLFSLFYSKSYVGAVGVSVYTLILIAFSINKKPILLVPHWLPVTVSIIIFIGCCIISTPIVRLAMVGIEQYFGRSGSLNARTMMWAQGLNAVKDNPAGYGFIIDFSKYIRLGDYYPSSAHNLYIDLAMQVGVLGSALFIYFLFYAQKSMPDWNRWIVIPAALFSYAVMWNFEPFFADPYFILLLILLFVFISMNFTDINMTNKTLSGDPNRRS